MKFNSLHKYLDKIFISLLIIIFFTYNIERLDYGLPFYYNLDEIRFLYSTLAYLSFITGDNSFFGDPIIAPLLSLILILKSIFINELLINSLSVEEIISKIKFNKELFIYYGRVASLITSSLSIFFLHLIFKKLKINFIIYSILLLTYSTSLITYHIASYHGKHAYYLLIFLSQFYFYFKYSVKLRCFNINAYIIFSILGALAWGVSYWPAFFSIYFVSILHFKKFKFKEIRYLITFFLIFFILGPVLGIIVSDLPILSYLTAAGSEHVFSLKITINEFLEGLKIIFFAEKNIVLLIIFFPLYFSNKYFKFKKEILVTLIIFFFPVILFALSIQGIPQLRYFAANICIILVIVSIIFNEFFKSKFKYIFYIFLISNLYFIYNNVNLNNKIDHIITKHSFFEFNKNIKTDRSKILYLLNLNFHESLKQNQLYLDMYNNNLIKKSDDNEYKISRIINKIDKINNRKKIIIDNKNLKENITYFNFSYHTIDNLDSFFEFIKKDFDYVVIEESKSLYLTNHHEHEKIKKYLKDNFIIEQTFTKEKKIFLRSQISIIHYYSNAINKYDYAENIENKNLDLIYGFNYSMYKIN